MKQRIAAWRRSILYLAVIAVVGSGLLVGALFTASTAVFTNNRAETQSFARLGELLDTVESTVSVACFVDDQNLAVEVARGLLKNSDVLGVRIRGKTTELVRSYREGASESALERAARGRQVRKIRSPFDSAEIVGEIIIDPDPEAFDRIVGEEVRFVGFLLWLQLATVVATIVAVVLRLMVGPLKGMSDRLHRMDATAGDRLKIPAGWRGTEIGRLAEDVNALADQLVASLDDERHLRLLREMDEKKYRAIFDNAETGIFIADAEGRVESGNPALARLLDLPNGSSGTPLRLADLAWQAPDRLLSLIRRSVEKNEMCGADLEYRLDGTGATRWLNVALSGVGGDRVQGIVSDVTERKLSEDTARLQAVTDPLTGAANRPGLEQRLAAAIRQFNPATGGGFALMLVDLDGFKRVNDALGLPVGDRILKAATEQIRSCIKSSDMVARIGGDEFAVMLPGVSDEETAAGIGDRIVRLLARSYEDAGGPIKLGASLGITLFPADGADLPSVLRNAELALDRARNSGGNRYTFFDAGMADAVARRRMLETDMQLALRRGEFRLFYQPIIDLAGNRLAGAEALIRWRHPERGLVPPDAFIPVAEETGFIVDIGLWGLETACRQIATWQAAGHNLYLSLNISGRQIPDGLPPQALAEAIARHDIEPWRLVLEITEGVLMADLARAQQWLAEVREKGMRFYLDDFGTGYSSLSYLKRFPVSTVKVDKSFVRDMHNDASDRALVGAIVAMANSLGMSVVAEGVETREQLELLRAMGCRYGQGYHFSKPVPAEEFDEVAARVDAMLAATTHPA